MTENTWILLGFDARYTEQDLEKVALSPETRETFFLNTEIENTLTVDSHLWPSHFSYYPEIAAFLKQPKHYKIDADSQLAPSLWLNLTVMKSILTAHNRQAAIVAIELFAPPEVTVAKYPSLLIYEEKQPATLPEGSILLGYDVTDAGFWSGLCNCGYSQQQRSDLRPRWAQKLNTNGLLATLEDALLFKEISDAKVPDHAPFWVHRMHRLTGTNGDS